MQMKDFPRLPLAQLPTPLHPLPQLRAALGPKAPRLLIKRDDLTGLALGGNKARKLEYLLADAQAQGADTLLTCGAAQSNHALQTAAAAGRYGFKVCCILDLPHGTGTTPTGNLRLHEILNTPIRWAHLLPHETTREQARQRVMAEEAQAVRSVGGNPYSIPTGGSTPVGALGYVRALVEALAQLSELDIDRLAGLFFASGSGGTQAGLVSGARLLGWKPPLIGVEVDPVLADAEGVSPFRRDTLELANATGAMLGLPGEFTLDDIHLEPGYAGTAYGAPTPEGQEAIQLLALTEGIFVDPVYSGKALSALIGWIRQDRFSPDETVLFWHTGGVAGLFAEH